MKKLQGSLLPFSFALLVIAVDQFVKMLIVASIEPWSIGFDFFDGLLRIVCVYNTGAAFSLGHNLPDALRFITLVFVPVVFIAGMITVYFKGDFSGIQRWFLSGIIGGGVGNLIDRFFRPQGVVDFIDVKFFGIFGLERWPTFNIADSVIVVCACSLFITILVQEHQARRLAGSNTGEPEV